MASGQHSFKHVPLSSNRPAATDPRKVFGSEKKTHSDVITRKKAFSLLGQYAKLDEDRIKQSVLRGTKESTRSNIVEDRTPVLGSTDEIYSKGNSGFFETVLMAYNHHYNLRTSPEDWWYCVIRRVALAIDKNSSKDSVRKMFVEHEGKKTLTVLVEWPLSSVNFSSFFEKMSVQIANNVKIPEYVDAMTANFSCTTSVQQIVSQITLMSSMQEFFEYVAMMMCGIPAIELLGTEADWQKLIAKMKALKSVLQPIMNDIELTENWWTLVEEIFSKLLDTYRGTPDKKWWSHIITYNAMFGSGFREHPELPPDYSGWIVEFLEGRVGLDVYEFNSGLVTVPLKIVDAMTGVEDTAALVAGMVGMTVDKKSVNNRPSVQPFQGWALMIPPKSPLTV